MHIALITDSFLPDVGGLEWKIHFLARNYRAKGHQVTVFAQRTRYRGNALKDLKIGYRLVRYSLPLPGLGSSGLTRLDLMSKFASVNRRDKIDVIHAHGLLRATQHGVFLKSLFKTPVVATPCGQDVQVCPEIGYGYRMRPRYDRIVQRNIRSVDWVGCISRAVREDILAVDERVNTLDVPNGYDETLFKPTRSDYLADHFGLAGKLIILSVGRYHIKKGYELGIEAFARLARKYKNVAYVIVGRGVSKLNGMYPGLEGLHLVEEVPMKEVPKFFASADIFLNPSYIEGFAQVNAQAMACGLPCVITESPGNADVGLFGGALMVQSSNARAVADALEQLMQNEGLREELGRQSVKSSRRFSWDSISNEYLALFNRISPLQKGQMP